MPELVAVIPAYNEAENIARIVSVVAGATCVDRVVVVDGRSGDRTAARAEAAGAEVLVQAEAAYPAKGAAVRQAVEETHEDHLLFFDADIHNATPAMVERLAGPVLSGEADHAVATYRRRGGRVTELTARPLLKLLFPEVDLRQPLAGEFCTRRDVIAPLDLEPGWGLESGLVIDVAMRGHRIAEVDLGAKEHDMKALAELHDMAVQVADTILRRAAQHARLPVEDAVAAIREQGHPWAPLVRPGGAGTAAGAGTAGGASGAGAAGGPGQGGDRGHRSRPGDTGDAAGEEAVVAVSRQEP